MAVEFDHVFVFTRVGAPEADLLSGVGFTEGQPNTHPGQGTACRRFFFRNAYLELLWVCDDAEAQRDLVRPLGLWERSRFDQTAASPFGLGLRAGRDEPLPFPTWPYQAPYLSPGEAIEIVGSAPAHDVPLAFVVRGGLRPDQYSAGRRQPLVHGCGAETITGLRMTGAHSVSWLADALSDVEMISVHVARTPLAELELDGGRQGGALDLRPSVPLTLRW